MHLRVYDCSEGVTTTEAGDLTTLAPRQSCGPLRAVAGDSVFRTFTSINLSGFTILLSGSTSKCNVSRVSRHVSHPVYHVTCPVYHVTCALPRPLHQPGVAALLRQLHLPRPHRHQLQPVRDLAAVAGEAAGEDLVVVLMLVMLQLPGLTGATAVTIAVTMIAGYYGAALLLASDTTNRSRQLGCRGRPAADDDCAPQDPLSCGGGRAS